MKYTVELRKMFMEDCRKEIQININNIKEIAFKKSELFSIKDYEMFKDFIDKELKYIARQEKEIEKNK